MAAARVNWHGQHLPVVREIVRIVGVETVVEIPKLAEPELRQIVLRLSQLSPRGSTLYIGDFAQARFADPGFGQLNIFFRNINTNKSVRVLAGH